MQRSLTRSMISRPANGRPGGFPVMARAHPPWAERPVARILGESGRRSPDIGWTRPGTGGKGHPWGSRGSSGRPGRPSAGRRRSPLRKGSPPRPRLPLTGCPRRGRPRPRPRRPTATASIPAAFPAGPAWRLFRSSQAPCRTAHSELGPDDCLCRCIGAMRLRTGGMQTRPGSGARC